MNLLINTHTQNVLENVNFTVKLENVIHVVAHLSSDPSADNAIVVS